jgi:hypothetical protein
MAKRCYPLRLDGQTVQLRLTVAGQRMLRERYQEDVLQTVLSAAGDGERMAALLEAALNWAGNHNEIQDGEELYDLLVDNGWSGQVDFGGLAFDIAAQSGLISKEQAEQLKNSIAQAVEDAFQGLEQPEKEEKNDPFGAD